VAVAPSQACPPEVHSNETSIESDVLDDGHRLHRGGNRQLNRALDIIAIARGRLDPTTRTHLAREEAEGKSWIEAVRCLKSTASPSTTTTNCCYHQRRSPFDASLCREALRCTT
jgi:hypothetical protein